jgi:hypothetical protein
MKEDQYQSIEHNKETKTCKLDGVTMAGDDQFTDSFGLKP